MKARLISVFTILLTCVSEPTFANKSFFYNLTQVTDTLSNIMIAVAYVAAIALILSAIGKFIRHKENPQQIHIGVPIIEVIAAILLMLLPNIAHFSDYLMIHHFSGHDQEQNEPHSKSLVPSSDAQDYYPQRQEDQKEYSEPENILDQYKM